MSAVTFDTLAYSKTLQESGIPQNQAEALANAQKIALNDLMSVKDLATQKDLLLLKEDLRTEISDTKHEIIKYLIGAMIAQTALLVTIIAFVK